jgi:hypothetical protein
MCTVAAVRRFGRARHSGAGILVHRAIILCMAIFAAPVTADRVAAEPMGGLLLDDRITVRGLSAIDPSELVRALAADDDLLLLSRPHANRKLFLSGVVRKTTLALQHAGFESPKVTAGVETTGEGSGEGIVVDVVEGPRSTAAGIEVTGLPADLAGALQRWLQGQRPPVGALPKPIVSADGWEGVRWLDDHGLEVTMEDPLWTRGDPAPLDAPHLKEIRASVAHFLRDEGRFAAAKLVDHRKPTGLLAGLSGLAAAARPTGALAPATVEVAVKPDAGGAVLAIEVTGLPPASVLRDVRLREGTRTTKEQLLDALGIELGRPVTEHDRLSWRQKLWRSGRFLRAATTLEETAPGDDGHPGLVAVFALDDYTPAPPLCDALSREEEVMLRFGDWLATTLDGGDDIVVTWQRPPEPGQPAEVGQPAGEAVFSPTDGILVSALPSSADACGMGVSADGLGCFLPRGTGRFEIPLPARGRLTGQISLSLSRKTGEGEQGYERNLSLGTGYASGRKPSTSPFGLSVRVDPVACLALVHEASPTTSWEGDTLVIESADMILRFDGPTGRLLAIDGKNGGRVGIRTAAGQFAATLDALRAAAGEDRARGDALVTSGIQFFTDTGTAAAFDRTFAAAGLPGVLGPFQARFGHLVEILRRTGAAGGFTAIDRLLTEAIDSAEDGGALPIPHEKGAPTDPLLEAKKLAAMQAWRTVERTCGRDNTLATLTRIAALGVAHDPAALEEMASFMTSEQAGPIAYLAAAAGAPMPILSVTLARRGQERLSTAAFHADCVPVLALLAARQLDSCAVVMLRAMSDDDARTLGGSIFHDPEFLLPLVRDLRSHSSDAAAAATLPEALDRWWDASLGKTVAAALADKVSPRTAAAPADQPVR